MRFPLCSILCLVIACSSPIWLITPNIPSLQVMITAVTFSIKTSVIKKRENFNRKSCPLGTTSHCIKDSIASPVPAGWHCFCNIRDSWHLSIKQTVAASVVQKEILMVYFKEEKLEKCEISWEKTQQCLFYLDIHLSTCYKFLSRCNYSLPLLSRCHQSCFKFQLWPVAGLSWSQLVLALSNTGTSFWCILTCISPGTEISLQKDNPVSSAVSQTQKMDKIGRHHWRSTM